MNISFNLPLANGYTFHAQTILRTLPNRRIVALGTYQDKTVIAKIFLGRLHAQRAKKEMVGLATLTQHAIPTPYLYAHSHSLDQSQSVLLFEYLKNAKTLAAYLQDHEEMAQLILLLKQWIHELATQHVFGVVQTDCHLKNFLIDKERFYTLDGASILQQKAPLDKKTSLYWIALALSQLGLIEENLPNRLLEYYAQLRGFFLKPTEVKDFFKTLAWWNQKRWARYQTKIFRASSHWMPIHHTVYHGMINRDVSPQLIHALKQPDDLFKAPAATLLKAGRSATVIKITLDQETYVIKRYNLKNLFHYLRRMFRKTRAFHTWRLSHKLQLFYVPVAQPIGFIEKRWLGLYGKAYYIMQALSPPTEKPLSQTIRSGVMQRMKQFAQLNIAHGDLKQTNILLDNKQRPVLVDLDGAKEYRCHYFLKRAIEKDKKRLS